jgi:hypothetical protein
VTGDPPASTARPANGADEVIIAGYGKLPRNTSAEGLHQVLAMVARVDRPAGRIVEVSITLGTSVAQDFLQTLLVGKRLIDEADDICLIIQQAYLGNAQRAILASFRDLVRRYQEATTTA